MAGTEGFLIIFRNSEGGSFLEWNVGGWDNKEHGIQGHLASHSTDTNVITQHAGSIEENRWYDVKIELNGSHVKCFLDGKLIHDVEIPAPDLARVYGTASLDHKTGEVILKVVNVADEPAATTVQLSGPAASYQAEAIVLTGAPDDENTITEPNKIQPADSKTGRISIGTAARVPTALVDDPSAQKIALRARVFEYGSERK